MEDHLWYEFTHQNKLQFSLPLHIYSFGQLFLANWLKLSYHICLQLTNYEIYFKCVKITNSVIILPNQILIFLQHLAASRGYEEMTLYLIREGVDLDAQGRFLWWLLLKTCQKPLCYIKELKVTVCIFIDNFGNTPLFEAIKNGHDRVASLLVKEGASLKIENAGSFLCSVVTRGDSDLLRRLLSNGVDSNSKDYNHQTPLHVAASQGSYLMANLLLEAHASVLLKDRCKLNHFLIYCL